jgi:hypothetical protein
VRVARRPELERFLATWKLHNPLLPEQLTFAEGIPHLPRDGLLVLKMFPQNLVGKPTHDDAQG